LVNEADEARVAMFRDHPPEWWAWPWRLPRPLSVTELIAAGSLDAPLAALLWLALERRTSIIVAAGPNGAGKTVTLTALLDFVPPSIRRVHLQGMAEDFAFVTGAVPQSTYLLCSEISDHLPIYLWGRRVRRLFELLPLGFALGATLHANSVEDTLAFLRDLPLGVPDALLARIPLVLTLAVRRRGGELLRRVASLHLLTGSPGGVQPTQLAAWDPRADRHRLLLDATAAPLVEALGLPVPALRAEIDQRARWLEDLLARGDPSPTALRAALAYWRSTRDP
jgi:hypothetical protein